MQFLNMSKIRDKVGFLTAMNRSTDLFSNLEQPLTHIDWLKELKETNQYESKGVQGGKGSIRTVLGRRKNSPPSLILRRDDETCSQVPRFHLNPASEWRW